MTYARVFKLLMPLPALLAAILIAFLVNIQPVNAFEKATIQLKWLHHYQFAGYYAALEKGFYQEAGLDVTILEGGPETDVEEAVIRGRADFGVGTSAILLNLAKGQDLVVLAQIFQHSPAALLTLRKSGIRSIPDMKGKRFMYSNQHGDMLALLKKNGITEQDISEIPHQGDPRDLIHGKADVMMAYSFNEPFILEELGEPYLLFSPMRYGIDFYGDNLFTSRKLAVDRPAFAAAFRAATLRGWNYALTNKVEIADLIISKYSRDRSREWLLYEANQLQSLIQPGLVEPGHQHPARWQHIAETFQSLGMLPPGFDYKRIIYEPELPLNYRPLMVPIIITVVVVMILSGLTIILFRLNRRLASEVDERKQAEAAQRESEFLVRESQQAASIGSYKTDFISGMWESSEVLDQIFGIDQNYHRGIKGWLDIIHPEDKERMNNYLIQEVITKQLPFNQDYRIIRKSDGEVRWVHGAGKAAFDAEGAIISLIGTIQDITERKVMDNALASSERFLNAIIDTEPECIKLLDEGCNLLLMNRAGLEMIQADSFEQVQGQCVCPLLTEPYRADFIALTKSVFQGNSGILDFEIVGLKGRHLWLETHAVPFRNEQGEITALLGITRDITARKHAEEEREYMQRQLLHAQKLESLGVLAGGIAHDFNNILTAIIGNADLALMHLDKESPAIDNLHRIEKAAARAADLAKQMLAYSGKGRFVIERIDLNRLLTEMLHMLEVSISKKAELQLDLTPSLPMLEADATQVRQIVMNLVINSSEALDDKSGVIAITTGYMDCDRNYLKQVWLSENMTDGRYVFLEITDTGCGMDQETLSKIFDPFFTTKFAGRGLGMAVVLGIVRGHKGAIKVTSEPGKGTTFKILLPASDKPAEILDGETHLADWKGSGTVLLVDDEESVRGTGSAMLKELGFDPITANDGLEAVELLKSTPDITCVILDLTMPHMDGEQCFRELRQLRPDIKVVVTSGFSEYEVTQKFAGQGIAGFIQKPYKMSSLREVLAKIS